MILRLLTHISASLSVVLVAEDSPPMLGREGSRRLILALSCCCCWLELDTSTEVRDQCVSIDEVELRLNRWAEEFAGAVVRRA